MMVDLHCHILPGLDDGAANERESLRMMRSAVKEGITIISATPHKNRAYTAERKTILAAVKRLNELINEHGLDLKIVPGQEIRLYGEIVEDYRSQKLITLGGDTRYILIEFPSDHVPEYTDHLFYNIRGQRLRPIIAHPERNTYFLKHPEKLIELVEQGAFIQITAASVVGSFGKKVQKLAYELMEASVVHIIASDAHNVATRGFQMKEAFALLEKKYGPNYVRILKRNAEEALKGNIISGAPLFKRKKILGIF